VAIGILALNPAHF